MTETSDLVETLHSFHPSKIFKHIEKERDRFKSKLIPDKEGALEVPTQQEFYQRMMEYRDLYYEETEGLVDRNIDTLGYSPMICTTDEKEVYGDSILRSTKIAEALGNLRNHKFTNRYEMLGAIWASIQDENSQTGKDQRAIFTVLKSVDEFRIGIFNQAWNSFLKSKQGVLDYQVLFYNYFYLTKKAERDAGDLMEKSYKYFEEGCNFLREKFPGREFKFPKRENIIFVPLGSLDRYGLEGNTDIAGKIGFKPSGMIDDKNPFSSGVPFFISYAPVKLSGDTKKDEQRQVFKTASILIHETVHGQGDVGEKYKSGTYKEVALEAITDFSTLLAFNGAGIGEKGEDGKYKDWSEKTAYYPYIYLIRVLQNEKIFGEKIMGDDEILQFGLDQNWEGFIKQIDENLKSMTVEKRLDFIKRLDDEMVIGPNQFDSLFKSLEHLNFEIIGEKMLEYSQEVGAVAYFNRGMVLMSIADKKPSLGDDPKAVVSYFIGKEGITDEVRKEKHRLIREYLVWRNLQLTKQGREGL